MAKPSLKVNANNFIISASLYCPNTGFSAREGNHSAKIGRFNTRTNTMLSVQRNGNDPRITRVTGTPVVPLTANKFKPTGGITAPISIANAVNIPR